MRQFRIGIVGIGNQGSVYAACLRDGAVPGARLAAVCARSARSGPAWGDAAVFSDASVLAGSGEVDAVVIATPHPSHADLAVMALEAGLHVLIDKPMASRLGDCQRILAAHDRCGGRTVLATMHHQRLDPRYRRLRQLLGSGECGRVQRFSWTVTDWFRTDAYYASAPWRGTWAGEHGGLLINQCPHQLDLLGWLFGRPRRVRATCRFGAHHPIQTEDEVHAILEYPDGMIGSFTASSGEAPGSNRLEVATARGLISIERSSLVWERVGRDVGQVRQDCAAAMPNVSSERISETYPETGPRHAEILTDFVAACSGTSIPVAGNGSGSGAVELANAMLLSGWEDRWIDLPLDAVRFSDALSSRCRAGLAAVGAGTGCSPAA